MPKIRLSTDKIKRHPLPDTGAVELFDTDARHRHVYLRTLPIDGHGNQRRCRAARRARFAVDHQ